MDDNSVCMMSIPKVEFYDDDTLHQYRSEFYDTDMLDVVMCKILLSLPM